MFTLFFMDNLKQPIKWVLWQNCFICHRELIQLVIQTCIFIFLRNTKGECLKICTGWSFPCSKMPKLDHVTLYHYILSFLKPIMGVNQILSHYLLIIVPSSKLLSIVTGWSELNSRNWFMNQSFRWVLKNKLFTSWTLLVLPWIFLNIQRRARSDLFVLQLKFEFLHTKFIVQLQRTYDNSTWYFYGTFMCFLEDWKPQFPCIVIA